MIICDICDIVILGYLLEAQNASLVLPGCLDSLRLSYPTRLSFSLSFGFLCWSSSFHNPEIWHSNVPILLVRPWLNTEQSRWLEHHMWKIVRFWFGCNIFYSLHEYCHQDFWGREMLSAIAYRSYLSQSFFRDGATALDQNISDGIARFRFSCNSFVMTFCRQNLSFGIGVCHIGWRQP